GSMNSIACLPMMAFKTFRSHRCVLPICFRLGQGTGETSLLGNHGTSFISNREKQATSRWRLATSPSLRSYRFVEVNRKAHRNAALRGLLGSDCPLPFGNFLSRPSAFFISINH